MSNSVFNVTEPDSNDSITLVVSPGGTVTPDKEIVKNYLSGRKSTDINVLTMKKVEVGHVNVTLDSLTYVNSEEYVQESSEMDEITYNLVNFRMDHDYTPFTSPEHRATLLGMQNAEVDELAQTLSLLEEGALTTIPTTPAPPLVALPAKTARQQQPEPLTKITKIVKGKKQTIFVNNKQKAKMISTGLLKEKPGSETGLFKRPKPVVSKVTAPKTVTAPPLSKIAEDVAPSTPPAEAKAEKSPPALKTEPVKHADEEEEEDEMDEIFDESEEEEFEDDDNDSDFELEEELKVKAPVRKTRSRKKSESSRARAPVKEKPKQRTPKKPEPEKLEPEPPKPAKPPSPPPPQPPAQEPKPPDKKPPPKKEKKPPKPMPDDFALFSTPDIIRRVGKEPPASPDKPLPSPTLPSPPKPAKILPENRSKSDAVKVKRLSSDGRDRSPDKNRRLSLEVKKQDRRPSLDVKQGAKLDDQVSVQEFADTLSNSNGSIPDDQLEPLPSAEDIRAIIQNENTKSFTSNLVIPEPDMHAGGPMNLDPAGLDLDQSILDNINTDLISEDILYQVAQSLVDNTDLQNAIDKSLDALDSGISHGLAGNDTGMIPSMENVGLNSQPLHHESSAPIVAGGPVQTTIKPGTQIVRPDGRVVVIPPIERPTTRSRNRKRDPSPQSTPTPGPRQPKPTHKPLDDEHVSGNELDSSEEEPEEEDDEDESEDDPNKLWCICNQPHNNRFMICCDTCEEWYHGKCVNVTKAMGHMMEQEGKEWICVYCKDNSLRRPKAAARRIRKASRTSTDSGSGSARKIAGNSTTSSSSSTASLTAREEKKASATGCVVCGKPSRNSSIYCSDSCILKHAQGVEKVVVFDRKSGKLLSGSNAPSAANLDKWLAENPTYEVVRSANKNTPNKHANLMQSKLKLVKNAGNDGVSLAVQKKGVNVGVLQHSPKEPRSPGTPQQPHFTRIPKKSQSGTPSQTKLLSRNELPTPPPTTTKTKQSPSTPKSSSTPAKPKLVQSKLTSTPVKQQESKQQPMPQKTPKARQAEISSQPKEENLRETVRKTFFDQLSNRLKKVDDLKLTEDELKGISNEIETQLYKCFGDTGQKYKNKYRSLIFNIKDPKNQTLWRRICEKAVNPYQLVRLSPDDLASQELALWREREAKHQLDMIKKSELEMLNCTRQYVFKTHKGEQVFEDDRPKDQLTEVISGLGADSTSPEKDDGETGKGEKDKKSSSKNSRRDKSKDRSRGKSRDGSKSRKEKSDSKERKVHRRSSSHDRKKRSKSKERSSRHASRGHDKERDRDRHRRSSHKTSRHKKDDKTIGTERLDKKSKEILEQLVDKNIVPPLEDKLWKHVPQEDIVPNPAVESDSDHEPTSTVTIPTPPRSSEPDDMVQGQIKGGLEEPGTPDDKEERIKSPISPMAEPIWKGSINMVDVAQISITAHEVSGDCIGLGEELSQTLDIVGRISPETVWDYIGKMKSSNSKTISVIRLVATNMEERMPYLALYSYLSSRNRLGVVKSMTKAIKDFYILPLASHTPIPDPLLPLSGPGFEESRPALLLGVLVRDKKKRTADAPPPVTLPTPHKRIRVELATPVVTKPSTPPSSSRSYTPPPSRDPRVKLPVPLPVPPPPEVSEEVEDDMDEPYSPEDSDPDTMPESASSHLNAEDISNLLTGSVKSSSFLESGLNTQTFEPFSNKFDTIPGLEEPPSVLPSNSLELQRKMAELDQRIAAQKAEIDKVSQDLVSSASSDIGSSALRDIALPSDLQQILASIKTIVPKPDSADSQGENSNSSIPSLATSDLTIPLMLPKLSSRPLIGAASAAAAIPKVDATTIPLNLPKSKSKADHEKTSSVLSSLSEEDLIKKAEEMLAESEPTKRTKEGSFYGTPPKRQRTSSQIPGLSDD